MGGPPPDIWDEKMTDCPGETRGEGRLSKTGPTEKGNVITYWGTYSCYINIHR